MAKILLVEDDREFAEALTLWLKSVQHVVDCVSTKADAKDLLKFYHYDLVILDVGLPDGSGLDICRDYREGGGQAAVIVLTGKNELSAKVEGLNVGADDYVTKPCNVEELSARIRAILRRPPLVLPPIIRIGNIELEETSFTVRVAGTEVKLQAKEFALLHFFMRHPNQVFSPEAILDRVWSSEAEASTHIVKVYINKLRGRLEGSADLSILSIRGLGYKLSVEDPNAT